jgi:hypothetical protein
MEMNTFRAIRRTIPSANWMKYAALRTGTFVLSYFCIIAALTLLFILGGITVSLGLIFGVIPFCVFLAIRISGVMTENHKE